MQLRLPWASGPSARRPAREIHVDGRAFPIEIRRRRGARRYIVRVTAEGAVRVTVPYGAAVAGGLAFAERQAAWIARQWAHQEQLNRPWTHGSEVWFRGTLVRLDVDDGLVRLDGDEVGMAPQDVDLRPVVVRHLRSLADAELPGRCRDLAAASGLSVVRVSVRNQRSRWGACSARGTITLNWRLVQVPPAVRDYVIHHELAHLRVLDHSRRFWREVERLCATWRESERWLQQHEREILC